MSHGLAFYPTVRDPLWLRARVESNERTIKTTQVRRASGSPGPITADCNGNPSELAARIAELEEHNRALEARHAKHGTLLSMNPVGLAMIEAESGSLEIESPPGHRTIVTLSLPVLEAPPEGR